MSGALGLRETVPEGWLGERPARRRGLRAWVLQDWEVNAGRPAERLVLLWWRLGQRAHARWGFPGRFLVVIPYTLVSTLLFSMELPVRCQVGPRLRLVHKHALVINPGAVIGADCSLRSCVTIGAKTDRDGVVTGIPRIGDGVDFGAGCAVIGGVEVGGHAIVGALAVVTKDVPSWSVVAGNPARVIRVDEPESTANLMPGERPGARAPG
jgi:putative colanic acid biosynthesis acetyltransferase WcaB